MMMCDLFTTKATSKASYCLVIFRPLHYQYFPLICWCVPFMLPVASPNFISVWFASNQFGYISVIFCMLSIWSLWSCTWGIYSFLSVMSEPPILLCFCWYGYYSLSDNCHIYSATEDSTCFLHNVCMKFPNEYKQKLGYM